MKYTQLGRKTQQTRKVPKYRSTKEKIRYIKQTIIKVGKYKVKILIYKREKSCYIDVKTLNKFSQVGEKSM